MELCVICNSNSNVNLIPICEKCYNNYCHKNKRGRPKKYGIYSLQEIANELKISRTCVWNYFNNLTIDGHKKRLITNYLSKEKNGFVDEGKNKSFISK